MIVYVISGDCEPSAYLDEQKAIKVYHDIIWQILKDAGHDEPVYESDFNACRDTYDWYVEEDINPMIVNFDVLSIDEGKYA